MSDWMAGQPTDDGRQEEERWGHEQEDLEWDCHYCKTIPCVCEELKLEGSCTRKILQLEAQVAQLTQARDALREQVLDADALIVKLLDCRVVCSDCSAQAMAFREKIYAQYAEWKKAQEGQSDAH